MKKKKICVVLTTRGNYAKMKSVIRQIHNSPDLELQIILGGMVTLEKYGRILEDLHQFRIIESRSINFVIEGEDLITMTKSAGLAVTGYSRSV